MARSSETRAASRPQAQPDHLVPDLPEGGLRFVRTPQVPEDLALQPAEAHQRLLKEFLRAMPRGGEDADFERSPDCIAVLSSADAERL